MRIRIPVCFSVTSEDCIFALSVTLRHLCTVSLRTLWGFTSCNSCYLDCVKIAHFTQCNESEIRHIIIRTIPTDSDIFVRGATCAAVTVRE
ncbi:hypothetical protein XENTR_v10024950 [Xenopus tropicalis]|nr:hypothetical protein XENTR_v10024950 [Xenopus tropicalis]